jgi:hypothetical protein
LFAEVSRSVSGNNQTIMSVNHMSAVFFVGAVSLLLCKTAPLSALDLEDRPPSSHGFLMLKDRLHPPSIGTLEQARSQAFTHGTPRGVCVSCSCLAMPCSPASNMFVRRLSSKNKWWNGISASESDDVVHEDTDNQQAGMDSQRRGRPDLCNASVQTEGQLLPYPPDSSWIQSRGRARTDGEEGSVRSMNADGRRADDASLARTDEHSRHSMSDLNKAQLGKKKTVGSPSKGDPLRAKQPGGPRQNRKGNVASVAVASGRYVQQRVSPGDYSSNRDETSIEGVFSIKGQSIKTAPRSLSADKKSRVDPAQLSSIQNQSVNDADDDDAVSSISVLTLSPRY